MAFEPQGKGDSDPQVALLLGVVSDLVAELRGGERLTVSLDSDLERELGLDSLARAELLSRVERVVQGRLPEDALGRVECPRDVLTLLMPVGPATRPAAQGAEAGSRSGPGIALPAEAGTLVEVLDWHARRTPERAYLHFYSGGQQLDSRSFGALHEAAGRMAGGLRAQGIGSGQTVALMLPTSVDFLAAFLGVMMAGAVPVPMYPPARRATLEDHLRRQAGILNNAQAVMLLTSEEVLPLAPLLKGLAPALRTVCRVADLPKAGAERPRIKAGDIAFLQYTSGSTGDPKGVVLSHANLLANIRAMGQAVGASPADVFVSWLPLYHDMGLIGAWLGSLYYGMNFVLMSPLAFLSRPLRWLQAIQRHGGTLSAGPNFAYELCLRRISDEELAGLDLRTWRCAFNGAEPISPVTLEAFCERFASCGFRREAMMPVYGLAECAVGLAFPPVNRGARVDTVQRRPFSRRGRALPAGPEQTGALRFVACGRPLPGHAIRIVDPAGRECPERVEGEVEFKGPSACQGYYRNPAATARLRHGEWLRSGDRAYRAGGEVVITGRVKDLIIRGGHNIYPQELEEAVSTLPEVRAGGVAAFGSRDPARGTERLVLVVETRRRDPARREVLRRQVADAVARLAGSPPEIIVLAPPGSVLKTSSGKVRRDATRQRFEQGGLTSRVLPPWHQALRLAGAGLGPWVRRLGAAAGEWAYGTYAWLVFLPLALVAFTAAWSLPRLHWRQKVAALCATVLARLIGLPIAAEGRARLDGRGPAIVVVNHASYVDALVLLTVLPEGMRYVAKTELQQVPLVGSVLRRLGCLFVERFDPARSVTDAERMQQAVADGLSLVFFAEGTFGPAPGLRPFRMGAFLAAVRTGVPVLPVALCGTRAVLPAGRWLPRRRGVRVLVGELLPPRGADWAAAVALRDCARDVIQRECGEPLVEVV